MTEHKVDQYSDEWARLRLGKPTASGFHKIITATGTPTRGVTRDKYKYRLVAERLLGQVMDDHYESGWMKRGSEMESAALEAFIRRPEYGVSHCGFYTAMDGRVGASPDAVMNGGSTGIEIKCPAPYTHVGYLIDGPGTDYKPQVQGQMWVCGFTRMHFWAWHPNMPPVHVVTERDEPYIARLRASVATFCAELDEAEAHCRGLGSYRLAEKLRLSEEMESVGDILNAL